MTARELERRTRAQEELRKRRREIISAAGKA